MRSKFFHSREKLKREWYENSTYFISFHCGGRQKLRTPQKLFLKGNISNDDTL